MANLYVRSTDGNNADSGATWALAKATIAGALSAAAAGDTIFVSQVHSESSASTVILTSPGTVTNPVKVVCVEDSAEPPVTLAESAVFATTGSATITFQGSTYWRGISFNCGSGASSTTLSIGSLSTNRTEWMTFESCLLRIQASGSGGRIAFGSGASGADIDLTLLNCLFRFGNAAQSCGVRGGRIRFVGCVVSAATVPVDTFFLGVGLAAAGARVLVENCDFSVLDTDFSFANTQRAATQFVVRNTVVRAGWTGSLVVTQQAGAIAEMYNTDGADTNYRLLIQTTQGTVVSETVIVRSGGASDGTTPLSWKMVTTSLAYPQAMASPEIAWWNEVTGSAVTVTVEIVHDSQGSGSGGRLLDNECWLEVSYPGTSGEPLGVLITDAVASVIATPAAQTDSTETWTTTGLGSPVKQKLAVTFTPQEKGWFIARVMVAKPTATVYVDPVALVS